MLYIVGFGLIFLLVSSVMPILTSQLDELSTKAIPSWLDRAQEYVKTNESLTIGGVELINLRELESKVANVVSEAAAALPGLVPKLLFGLAEGFILGIVFIVVTFDICCSRPRAFPTTSTA